MKTEFQRFIEKFFKTTIKTIIVNKLKNKKRTIFVDDKGLEIEIREPINEIRN